MRSVYRGEPTVAKRMRRLLAVEPDLEAWQLAERLGISEEQARDQKATLRYRSRNMSDARKGGATKVST